MEWNVNQLSEKTLKKNVMIEEGAKSFANEHDKKIREEISNRENALNEEGAKNAQLGYYSTISRSKMKVRALQEALDYTNNSAKDAICYYMEKIVNESLLLDKDEYTKLNPRYKDDIHDLCESFLESGRINENITNKDTLTLFEDASKKIPTAEKGKKMKSDEFKEKVSKEETKEAEAALKTFSKDVSKQVAKTLAKEQAQNNAIDADKTASGVSPKNEQIPQDAEPEEMNAAQQEQEMPAQEVPQEDISADPIPKKQIQFAPDGTMNINIFENKFVKDAPRTGLIESLAYNEGMEMINEGKEYNGDLALANAIMYTTVLEAFDVTGLITFTEEDKNNIIRNAGGSVPVKITKSKKMMTESGPLDPNITKEKIIEAKAKWKASREAKNNIVNEEIDLPKKEAKEEIISEALVENGEIVNANTKKLLENSYTRPIWNKEALAAAKAKWKEEHK